MSERAGELATQADLVDLAALQDAYFHRRPRVELAAEQISFGTSGHRGSALKGSFNEAHIAAVCLAVAEYRCAQGWQGPLFLGADTHALSEYALETARAVFVAAGVQVRGAAAGEYVPTPALSHAILRYNRDISSIDCLADGVVITPSHNPPADGGIKYNPPHAGPADTDATSVIAASANQLLARLAAADSVLDTVQEIVQELLAAGRLAANTGSFSAHDFLAEYVADLPQVVDMQAIADAGLRFAAHPLGGAAVKYWQAIADTYSLDLTVAGPGVDKQWSFMSLDWDGQIRMDPSSVNAMRAAIDSASGFDLLVANDADADRHGIVVAGELMNPNHFLAVAVDYLLRNRPGWQQPWGVGKTIVSSALLDRVVAAADAQLYETPVGFKWFVSGLTAGDLVFAGEESAGASLLTFERAAWSTDKDGIALCLLAAEIYAKTGISPAEYYNQLVQRHGEPFYARTDMPATAEQKTKLLALDAASVSRETFAGEQITDVLTSAPGNNAALGGLVVRTANAWAAIRPSGTEAVMKVYAESFISEEHLTLVQQEAQQLLTELLQ